MATMAQAIRMALHYGEENLGITEFSAKTSARHSVAFSPLLKV